MIKLLILSIAISIATSFTPTTYTYKTVGNLSIELDVYTPNASNYTKYPVFFEIHGGAFIFSEKSGGST